MGDAINEISEARYHNKPIKVQSIVSGKSSQPYGIPKTVHIECLDSDCSGGNGQCKFTNGKDVVVEPGNEKILYFIDVKSSHLKSVVRQVFTLRCKEFSCEVKDVQNIERVFISQPTGQEVNKWGEARMAFYVGHGIDVNTQYLMTGYTTIDPSNQAVTHVFTKAEKIKSDVEGFILTSRLQNKLNEFCVSKPTPEKLYDQLEKIYNFYEHNVTKITKRFLLHLSIDLVFHSVISYDFGSEYVHKGWLDVMVIGDGRCGKGFVAERLARYYGVGEIIGADNASFAGLVGGMQQYNRHWVVTWGRMPMNDKGLLIVDEAGNITEETWAKLSRIRSEGIAEVRKIHSQETNARTRTIYLANPPYRAIASYSYGVQSISDLVKTPEDIARFDYCCVVAKGEVNVEDINKTRGLVSSLYPRNLERDRVMWVWSRKKDEIVFTDKATKLIYEQANRLAKMYDSSIPLIQGENVRFKIAKIAICFAGRFFSHTEKGKILVVTDVHVECAIFFINMQYRSESNGYLVYSRLKKMQDVEHVDEHIRVVEAYFDAYANKEDIYRCLLQNNTITVNDLVEQVNLTRDSAIETISTLIKNGLFTRRAAYYVKSSSFTSWLKKRVVGGSIKL